jgi:Na+-transporting methylmalonyl-CoA/oxaloacetate decarboxylase gamma subunit
MYEDEDYDAHEGFGTIVFTCLMFIIILLGGISFLIYSRFVVKSKSELDYKVEKVKIEIRDQGPNLLAAPIEPITDEEYQLFLKENNIKEIDNKE